jgi:hypothetical protein
MPGKKHEKDSKTPSWYNGCIREKKQYARIHVGKSKCEPARIGAKLKHAVLGYDVQSKNVFVQ